MSESTMFRPSTTGRGHNRMRTLSVLTVLLLGSAGAAVWLPAQADHAPFVAPTPDYVDVAAASGLDFTCEHWNKNLGLGARWFLDVLFCASPVLADFNGDGYTDVFFPNLRYTYESLNAKYAPSDRMFLNNGDGTFSDVTAFVGIADLGYSGGAAAIDYDNDGDLDLYVANYPNDDAWYPALTGIVFDSPSTDFYVNNGDGTFTRDVPDGLVTRTNFGRLDNQMGMAAAVADYDGDGFLDIYRGNYIKYRLPSGMPAGLQLTVPDSNNLYHNNGDGTFTDVTFAAGASDYEGRTFAVNFVDFSGDMLPDLYVANDENPNEYYINNGDGTFTESAAAAGINDPRGSMCSEAADFDNDGGLDLYMSHYENEYNGFYLNNGDGTWAEHSEDGDLADSYTILGWACPGFDMDNDGDLDLFVANGHMLPIGGQFPGGDDDYELPNWLYRNRLIEDGVQSFEEIHALAGPGMGDRFVSSGAMAADFDLDGSMEIIVVENNDVPTKLLSNTAPGNGHWLNVELRQSGGNIHAIGAKVVVTTAGLEQTRYMMTGNTLASGSVAPLHFGLGGAGSPAIVAVTWPDGTVQTETVAVDMPVRIVKGSGFELDTLAPGVDVDVVGTLGDDGWYTSPALTVSLSATERGMGATSGVADLSYSLDGAAAVSYTGPFGVAGEGEHRLVVYAEDGAGNRAWYPTTFKIDSVAPSCSILAPLAGKIYVQDRAVADSPDGRTYIITPVRTPDETARDTDSLVAGWQHELDERFGVPTDPAPSLAGLLGETVGSDGRTTLAVLAADATSGLRHVWFGFDDGRERIVDVAPYEWRIDLRGAPVGTHSFAMTARDEAGHTTDDTLEVVIVPTTRDGVTNTVMNLLGGL